MDAMSGGSTVAAPPDPSPWIPPPLPNLPMLASVEIRVAPANPHRIAGPQVLRVAPVPLLLPSFSLPPDLPSLRSLSLPCFFLYRSMEAAVMDVVSSSSSTDGPPVHEPAIEAHKKREPRTSSPRILLISLECMSKGTKAQLSQCSCWPQPPSSVPGIHARRSLYPRYCLISIEFRKCSECEDSFDYARSSSSRIGSSSKRDLRSSRRGSNGGWASGVAYDPPVWSGGGVASFLDAPMRDDPR